MRSWQGFAYLLAAVALGCKSPPAVSDPFMGARVPPPSTGQVGVAPVATYGSAPPPYTGAPLAPVTPPPGSVPPASIPAATAAAPYSVPPPAYQTPPPAYQTPPPAGAPASPPYTPPSGGWTTPTSSTGTPETKSIYDRDGMQQELRPLAESARAGAMTNAAGREFDASSTAPSEMSVGAPPELADDTIAKPLRDPANRQNVQPTSYTAPAGAPPRGTRGASESGLTPTSQRTTSGRGPADQGATYGFDGNYAWLHGQLEYSQATRQWKLRYIPIDGPTDKYGGSVVLASSPALNGHKAGDFVSVKGRLDASRVGQGNFAPLYQVSSVDRLTD